MAVDFKANCYNHGLNDVLVLDTKSGDSFEDMFCNPPRTKMLQLIAKLCYRFGYQKRCQFWGHVFVTPRAHYYIPNINKTWNHFRSLNWGHIVVPNLGTYLHSLFLFFVGC